uniref:Putative helicase n=2 Tax=viral metagenome TaxID=1070528 RepID=A0A6M3L9Y6_9ZZZZ
MPEDQAKKLYARAHQAIEDLIPSLKGERLTREQWQRLLNINPNNPNHIPYKNAVNDVLRNISAINKKRKLIKEGSYFKVPDDSLTRINFLNASGDIFDLTLPFDIQNYCFLYRKNLMIIYGSKDAGKTTLMLNIIKWNMNKYRTLYFSSEMVESELAGRLKKDDSLKLEDWNFEAYERSYDFDQVVEPDALNLIDFLELGGDDSEYYKGVSLIRKIYDKLDNGVAIIACQKNRDANYPKGGSGLLEKARIALSLDPGKATLTIAKNWGKGIESSPTGKKWTYKIVGGIKIFNPQESYNEDDVF